MDVLALMRARAGDYHCPGCRRALDGCGLELLAEDAPRYTVQVTCAACAVSFVVLLQLREGTAPAAHPAATGSPGGAPSRPPISADEVLDLHELLDRHRGPLSLLLGPRA